MRKLTTTKMKLKKHQATTERKTAKRADKKKRHVAGQIEAAARIRRKKTQSK